MRTSIASGTLLTDIANSTGTRDGAAINFISRIVIIGNIAGSRVFSVVNSGTTNQDVGYSYNTINHSNMLDLIRRNVALMTRNVTDTMLMDYSSQLDFVLFKNQDFRIDLSGGSIGSFITSKKKTLIVQGGDIVIDDERVNAANWDDAPIALIALKGTDGK